MVHPGQSPDADFALHRKPDRHQQCDGGHAPAFEDVAAEVLARLAGRLFIAHNARFDYGFLKNEFKRAGHDFRATVLCTVKLSRKLFPQHPRHNLDSLIARHGLVVSERHRALGDARLIHQFWQQLLAGVEPGVLEATVAKLTARPSLPANLDAGDRRLPDGPGVYLFLRRERLAAVCRQEHRHPQARARAFRRRPRHGEGNGPGATGAPHRMHSDRRRTGALLKEAALVKKLQPIHNRSLRRNDELCFWQLVEARQGEWRPQLVLSSELPASGRTALRALQDRTRSQATCCRNWRASITSATPCSDWKSSSRVVPASPTRCSNARVPASARNRFPFTARA
jgi:DNA polymerase-3 subunit epsilon